MSNVSIKWCRHCGRVIALGAADCPYCGKNTIRGVQFTRECPFCGEEIKAKAVKCKHCHEFLDGRASGAAPSEAAPAPTIIIEKAIIAQQGGEPGEPGQVHLLRPDGSPVEAGQLDAGGRPAAQLGPGRPKALTGDTAPADTEQNLPVRAEVVDQDGNPPAAGALARRAAEPPARREKPGKAEPKPTAPEPTEPEMVVCPSCGRVVFEDDNYCENCGHDMSKRAQKKASAHEEKVLYQLTRYALLLAAGAPAFLAFKLPVGTVAAAGAGIGAGVVSLSRIRGARHRLTGRKLAVTACIIGALWLLLGAMCM